MRIQRMNMRLGANLRSGGASFSPASLFADGKEGVWYAPGPSTAFQDTAGTTPAGLGDPVGRINDLSGNGHHATQATAASRPLLQQAGGLRSLNTDGVDDFLASPDMAVSDNWFVAWVGSFNSYANFFGPWRWLAEGQDPVGAGSNRLESYVRGTQTRTLTSRKDASDGIYDTGSAVYPAADTKMVVYANRGTQEKTLGEIHPGTSRALINPSNLPYSTTGTAALHLARGYLGQFAPMKIHEFIFVWGDVSPEQREATVSYLMNKYGVTL